MWESLTRYGASLHSIHSLHAAVSQDMAEKWTQVLVKQTPTHVCIFELNVNFSQKREREIKIKDHCK